MGIPYNLRRLNPEKYNYFLPSILIKIKTLKMNRHDMSYFKFMHEVLKTMTSSVNFHKVKKKKKLTGDETTDNINTYIHTFYIIHTITQPLQTSPAETSYTTLSSPHSKLENPS